MNAESQENPANRREHYRMRLEPGYELKAVICGRRSMVTEVSEYGMRVAGANVPERNGCCDGVLTWSDGRTSEFSGKVDRVHAGETIIVEIDGFAMSYIVEEQRRANRMQHFRLVRNY